MTKKEFKEKMADIKRRFCDLEDEKKRLKIEYADSIDGPYKHLVGKWVTATYRDFEKERTITGFWKGIEVTNGSLIKVEVYKPKKDGSPSSRVDYQYITELVNVVEVE